MVLFSCISRVCFFGGGRFNSLYLEREQVIYGLHVCGSQLGDTGLLTSLLLIFVQNMACEIFVLVLARFFSH